MSKWGRILPQTHCWWCSDLRDWVYALKTDSETLSSLVSNTRLRPRLNILESRDLRVFQDQDFPRLSKICRDQEFFETLVDLFNDVTYCCFLLLPLPVPSTKPLFYGILIVWSLLLVVRSRQKTNYLTGQSRQGSNYFTGLSRKGSNYLMGLFHQIAFPFIERNQDITQIVSECVEISYKIKRTEWEGQRCWGLGGQGASG